MKLHFMDLVRLVKVLDAKLFVIKSKYGDLDLSEIDISELDKDINVVSNLVDGISFKKDLIVDSVFDMYFKEYSEQESLEVEQEKVIT